MMQYQNILWWPRDAVDGPLVSGVEPFTSLEVVQWLASIGNYCRWCSTEESCDRELRIWFFAKVLQMPLL